MSVQSEIDRIKGNVARAYTAVADMGGELPEQKNSAGLEAAIRSIPSGGGGSVTLGQLLKGSSVQLNEGGQLADFYVAKHNYEVELNGEGRTLLVRKDVYDQSVWNASGVNTYADSTVDVFLNGDYKSLLDADIQEKIGTTKFYYTIGNKNATVSVLERAVFLLSYTELGLSNLSYANVEGEPLGIEILKVAIFDNRLVDQWTRSPNPPNASGVLRCRSSTISALSTSPDATYYFRPCFALPSNYVVYNTTS